MLQGLRRRMVASLLAMLLATLPCVPVKSKWLQPGPCVDWFLLSMVTSVLQGLWPPSFGREKDEELRLHGRGCLQLPRAGGRAHEGRRRFCHELAVPNNPHCRSIISEPLRYLTRWFLSRRSHASQSKTQLWQTCPFDGPGECAVQLHRPRAAILCLVPLRRCSEVAPVVGAIPRVVHNHPLLMSWRC